MSDNLNQYSLRSLNLFASYLSDQDARVTISERYTNPLTVSLGPNTIALNPDEANIYDLILGAFLLRMRKIRNRAPANPDRQDDWLTRQAIEKLVPKIHRYLSEKFPSTRHLPGLFKPGKSIDQIRLTMNSVQLSPLEKVRTKFANVGRLEQWSHPDLDLLGTEEDADWLMSALNQDALALKTLDPFPEFPYARIQLKGDYRSCHPLRERYEAMMNEEDFKNSVQGLMRCVRRKSEVLEERLPQGKHQYSGVHMDSNRLVDVAVAQKLNRQPRVFRKKRTTIEPIFHADEHVAVLLFDLNDLCSESLSYPLRRTLAMLITVYLKLEIDLSILGVMDRRVELSDGREVFLHGVLKIKSFNTPTDSSFWDKLFHLFDHPPKLPGEAIGFHPLQADELYQEFQQISKERSYSYRHQIWYSRRWMNQDLEYHDDPDLLARGAHYVDSRMHQIERLENEGVFDTLPSFLPRILKSYAKPGGYLSKTHDL